jgi:uridine kinase
MVHDIDRPRVLVAVDGASGTGKSTFADELVPHLDAGGRECVRASIDSFHRPRDERYRRGVASPEGFYLDSHDLAALRRQLLDPFTAGADSIRTEVFDEPTDQPLDGPRRPVSTAAVLVFDGLFLQRSELVGCWHLGVFLIADDRREAAWQDYLTRDLPSDPERRTAEMERRVQRARRDRYTQGQALYENKADPARRAMVVIDNDDFAHPRILRSIEQR